MRSELFSPGEGCQLSLKHIFVEMKSNLAIMEGCARFLKSVGYDKSRSERGYRFNSLAQPLSFRRPALPILCLGRNSD
jgi:hypothetical protein